MVRSGQKGNRLIDESEIEVEDEYADSLVKRDVVTRWRHCCYFSVTASLARFADPRPHVI